MSILGSVLGMGTVYCQQCGLSNCVHVSCVQQQQYMNSLLSQAAQQQSTSISIANSGSISSKNCISVGQSPEPKPNKKLLLLME